MEDFATINRELRNFSPELADRPQIVAGNKCDLATPEQIAAFKEFVENEGYSFYPITAATRQGVDPLIKAVAERLADLPPIREYEPEPIPVEQMVKKGSKNFTIRKEDGIYMVEGPWLMEVFGMVDLEDEESLQYFQRVLRDSGIIEQLEEMGIQEGDTVNILDFEFDYVR